MDVTKVLQFADNLIFTETGKHLDDLQKAVVKGVWEGKTYEEIGQECNRSESRVRDVGYKLWQLLSKVLDENIDKFNFKSTIERIANSSYSNSSPQQVLVGIINDHVNLCLNTPHSQNRDSDIIQNLTEKLSYKNLTLAPKISQFYGRDQELLTLSQWIENPNTRLISVLGIRGIGKTTLVKHFLDINSLNFDAIIWKDLKLSPDFNALLSEIITINKTQLNHSKYRKTELDQAFESLRHKKHLIILDNVQDLFTLGQFAGQYQPEHQDYQTFFRMITTLEHQGCIMLISSEKCQEMIPLDDEIYPIKCLELQGLREAATEILTHQKNDQQTLTLINLYEGHPYYLQSIHTLIKETFAGNLSEFIAENDLVLTTEIKALFDSIWLRLTEAEKIIILTIFANSQPLSRDTLRPQLSLSSSDFIQGLHSLNRRYLLKVIEGERILYQLNPIFQEYIKNYQ